MYQMIYDPDLQGAMWLAFGPANDQIGKPVADYATCYAIIFADAVKHRRMAGAPAPMPKQEGRCLIWDVVVTGEMPLAIQADMAAAFGVAL